MKILTVASPWLGGSGTVGFEIGEYLSRDHQSFFISFDFPYRQSAKDNFLLQSVAPATYSLFSYPLYHTSLIEKIVEMVRRFEIEIIHAHYSIVFGESAVMAKKILQQQGKKVGLVLTFHGSDAIGFSTQNPGREAFYWVNRWLSAEAERITTASGWLADFVKKHYAPKEKVCVIPNFYDDDLFVRQSGFKERKQFLHVSNFRKVKRPLLVVKAFSRLLKWVPGMRLVLVGDGPEKENVFRYLRKEGISKVCLREAVNKEGLRDLYNQSLALILPSRFENFPLAVLEAAACGTPTIAVRVGGLPEIVKNGQNGFLVENKAETLVTELADKMLVALDPNRWRKLSRQAVGFAGRFTKAKIITRYENLYQEILPLFSS